MKTRMPTKSHECTGNIENRNGLGPGIYKSPESILVVIGSDWEGIQVG